MTVRRIAMVTILGFVSLPLVALLLFALNGLLLCDGTKSRAGSLASSVDPPGADPHELRLMAFNIAKGFAYKGGLSFDTHEAVSSRLDVIATIIREHNPDIVCLSEVLRECGPCNINQVEYLSRRTGLTNWAFGECYSFGLPFYRAVGGNAILSRYPVSAVANLTLAGRKPFYVTKNNRRALAAMVSTPVGELTVWSIHNDSFNLSNNLDQVRQILENPLSRQAFLAVDFNAQPATDSMRAIRESERFVGEFFGPPTLPSWKAEITIDYVLAPTEFELLSHMVVSNDISDHHAVVAQFQRVKRLDE